MKRALWAAALLMLAAASAGAQTSGESELMSLGQTLRYQIEKAPINAVAADAGGRAVRLAPSASDPSSLPTAKALRPKKAGKKSKTAAKKSRKAKRQLERAAKRAKRAARRPWRFLAD